MKVVSNFCKFSSKFRTKQAQKGFWPLSAMFVIQSRFEVFHFQVFRLNNIQKYFRVYFYCTVKFLAFLDNGRIYIFVLQNSWNFQTMVGSNLLLFFWNFFFGILGKFLGNFWGNFNFWSQQTVYIVKVSWLFTLLKSADCLHF